MNADVVAFGDSALLIKVEDVASAHGLAGALESARRGADLPDAIDEWVVGFGNVVVHLDPADDTSGAVARWLRRLTAVTDRLDGARPADDGGRRSPLDVPVSFDGPDLGEVASFLDVPPAEVVHRLTGATMSVAFLGFSPGFPYLVGLPPDLASVPRRPTPRPSVPAGSVAIGGGFASVYPQSTPGGWMLLGRTTVSLFDPAQPPYALLRPGDVVRFSDGGTDTGSASGAAAATGGRSPLAPPGKRFAEVVDPGLLSLIEDGGRRGSAGLGVPRAGPADPETMGLANRLVGNPVGAAAIEVTAVGPTLRFHGDAHVAVVAGGADGVGVGVEGHPVGAGTVVPVHDGQTLAVGQVRTGLRAYLAVAGAFDTPLVVGSRSSDLLCGLGPGPLRAGDRLGLGPPTRPRGRLEPEGGRFGTDARHRIRVIPGPHPFPDGQLRILVSGTWRIGDSSNRIGLRLLPAAEAGPGDPSAPPGPGLSSRVVPSTGMVSGAIQVPPDGRPIVLMPDHATVGGYPVIACVAAVDLPVLGRLRPGDLVTFSSVDRAEAHEARHQRDLALAAMVSGWFPTAAGS